MQVWLINLSDLVRWGVGEQTGLGEGGGKGGTSVGLDGAARQLSSRAESERSVNNRVRMEDGNVFMCKFVGTDGHPNVGSRGHVVSSSFDLVCPCVGQCWDTPGPTQGHHVPSLDSECDPFSPKTLHPVEGPLQG